jgi:hypothetical protein
MVHMNSFSSYVLYSPLCTDVWNRSAKHVVLYRLIKCLLYLMKQAPMNIFRVVVLCCNLSLYLINKPVIFLRFYLRIIIFMSSEIFSRKLNYVNRKVVSDLRYSEQTDRSYLINN